MNLEKLYLLVGYIITSTFGLLLNVLVISISLKKNLIKGEYRWFICALACADLLLCFLCISFQPYYIYTDEDTLGCKIFGFLYTCIAISTVTVLPLLSLDRYVALYHRNIHPKYFSQKYCLIWISLCIFLAFISNVPLGIVAGRSGKFQSLGICASEVGFENVSSTVGSLTQVTGFLFSYAVNTYCNVKIYQKIKQHQNGPLNQVQVSNLQRNKELFKVATLQGIAPLVCQSPVVLGAVLGGFASEWPVYGWFNKTGILIFLFNSVCNPIVTLVIVKTYQKPAINWFKQLRHAKCVLETANAQNQEAVNVIRLRRVKNTSSVNTTPADRWATSRGGCTNRPHKPL